MTDKEFNFKVGDKVKGPTWFTCEYFEIAWIGKDQIAGTLYDLETNQTREILYPKNWKWELYKEPVTWYRPTYWDGRPRQGNGWYSSKQEFYNSFSIPVKVLFWDTVEGPAEGEEWDGDEV